MEVISNTSNNESKDNTSEILANMDKLPNSIKKKRRTNLKQLGQIAMKKTRLIIMVIMLVLFGGTTANLANAQVYLYYDPFEVADPDIEPTEEEEDL